MDDLRCLCFASGFLPTPHCCDAVAFGYLIPPCQRILGTFTPVAYHGLTYPKNSSRANLLRFSLISNYRKQAPPGASSRRFLTTHHVLFRNSAPHLLRLPRAKRA